MGVPAIVQYLLAFLVGLAPVFAAGFALRSEETPPSVVFVTPPDLLEEAASEVLAATMNASLVQWGTTSPFRGTGPPGVNLRVDTPGSIIGWTLDAWANETTPPPFSVCATPGVHFSEYDWTFEADGSGGGGHGVFVSTPSTVPHRLGPTGDQCLLRVGETGVWHVRVCIEGKPGGPRGLTRDAEGRLYNDPWDRCIEKDVQVRP